MENDLLTLNGVTKRIENRILFRNVQLTVQKNQAIAITGHNGCGKSTLLNIMAGFSAIQSGTIKRHQDLKINFVPESFPRLAVSARKYVQSVGLIEGIPAAELEVKSQALFKQFFLEEMVDTPLKHLSKGTLQKIAVIQALLTVPDILLLDEPLSGQDSDSQKVFIQLMNEYVAGGGAIVMSCHEKYLIHQVATVAYEMTDKSLQEKAIEPIHSVLQRLHFSHQQLDQPLPAIVSEASEKVEQKEHETVLIVTSDKSHALLQEMLQAGFELRRMTDEIF
ncbi:ABC transporter ATP-binding protein [Isobaculum melis]|uniref:ABC-type multidrug transport system, ATPase component n=1 Tax=Isobaculum melis TaxID=142588 RepID=A0A1H9QSD8_9LACT|nr:ATP-binding cassette domain-containing protein [Isobaculum melis]SER63297.1 ABC-type multidrug transport system, ATPase component [Isobaculum melis]